MIPLPMFHKIGFVELLLEDLVEERQKLSDFEMGFLFEGEQKPQSVRKHLKIVFQGGFEKNTEVQRSQCELEFFQDQLEQFL